jgi:hypothetical protein
VADSADVVGLFLERSQWTPSPLRILQVHADGAGRHRLLHGGHDIAVAALDVRGDREIHHGRHPGDSGEQLRAVQPLTVRLAE